MFAKGHEHVEDASQEHRPHISIIVNNIRLESDRRLRITNVANEVEISYCSTFSMITNELEFRKLCAT